MDARRDTPEKPNSLTRGVAEASDQDLVEEYAATRSAEVFNRIVERHGPMVLHTSHRLVGNWHDAEDVTQAVFLVLAQRASSVKSTLAGWLYKVARDVSLQMLRARARRTRREEVAVRRQATPNPKTENDLREELDLVLVQLPDRMREAVVLRYFEGRGQEEAARMAGCDNGTLSRRCTQGLSRLGSLLSRRGVVVAPAVLGAFLVNQSAGTLSAATLSTLGGIGVGGAASAQASLLAKGAIHAMFWAKAKLCAAVVAVATVVGAGAITPLMLSSSPKAEPKEVLLRFDFEDGNRPVVWTGGKVVAGPERPGNRFCLEGDPFPGPGGKWKVFLEKEGGLFTYSDDLVLIFDLWVDGRVSTVDLHFWNQTQQASMGVEPLRVARDQWIQGVVVRFADFRFGNTPPKPGDIIASLAIQVGQVNGTIYVDNVEITRQPSATKK